MKWSKTDLFCGDLRVSGDVRRRRWAAGWPERDREAEIGPGGWEAELPDTTPSRRPAH